MGTQRSRSVAIVIALTCLAGLICHPAWAAPPAAASSTRDTDTGPTLIRSTGAAADTPPAKPADDRGRSGGDYALARLADPTTPLAERREIFAAFEHYAEQGNYYTQYLVGSIYRLGEHGAVPIVPQDLAKARRYLSNAAVNGYYLSMAKMAELELADHHPLDAMVWAQIYGYYTGAFGAKKSKDKASYYAELVYRISERLPKNQMPTVLDDLNQFIANYDAHVRAGSKAIEEHHSRQSLTRTYAPSHADFVDPSLPSGIADYVIGYRPDGTAAQAWLLDAVPTPEVGRSMRDIAILSRVTPDPDTKTLRYTSMPVTFISRRYSTR